MEITPVIKTQNKTRTQRAILMFTPKSDGKHKWLSMQTFCLRITLQAPQQIWICRRAHRPPSASPHGPRRSTATVDNREGGAMVWPLHALLISVSANAASAIIFLDNCRDYFAFIPCHSTRFPANLRQVCRGWRRRTGSRYQAGKILFAMGERTRAPTERESGQPKAAARDRHRPTIEEAGSAACLGRCPSAAACGPGVYIFPTTV